MNHDLCTTHRGALLERLHGHRTSNHSTCHQLSEQPAHTAVSNSSCARWPSVDSYDSSEIAITNSWLPQRAWLETSNTYRVRQHFCDPALLVQVQRKKPFAADNNWVSDVRYGGYWRIGIELFDRPLCRIRATVNSFLLRRLDRRAEKKQRPSIVFTLLRCALGLPKYVCDIIVAFLLLGEAQGEGVFAYCDKMPFPLAELIAHLTAVRIPLLLDNDRFDNVMPLMPMQGIGFHLVQVGPLPDSILVPNTPMLQRRVLNGLTEEDDVRQQQQLWIRPVYYWEYAGDQEHVPSGLYFRTIVDYPSGIACALLVHLDCETPFDHNTVLHLELQIGRSIVRALDFFALDGGWFCCSLSKNRRPRSIDDLLFGDQTWRADDCIDFSDVHETIWLAVNLNHPCTSVSVQCYWRCINVLECSNGRLHIRWR